MSDSRPATPVPAAIDLLAIAVVAGDQTDQLFRRLNEARFPFTVIDSQGGVLQEATVCLLIGLVGARRSALLQIIGDCCHTRRQFIPARLEATSLQQPVMIEAEVGGATVYMVAVERYEQI